MKPYCIEINVIKPRIIFHYKEKPDKVIDKKSCYDFVEKSITKSMPNKSEIDKKVRKQIHAHKTSIENSLTIPDSSKARLLGSLETDEGIENVKRQVTNRLRSEIKERLAEALLKEHIDRAVNNEWLKDALQLVKG